MGGVAMNVEAITGTEAFEQFKTKAQADREIEISFARVMESFKRQARLSYTESKRKADEDAAEVEKERQKEKLNDLFTQLARLKAKLASLGGDAPGIETQIAAIETELLLMMLM
jgi:5'-3' exonuclease